MRLIRCCGVDHRTAFCPSCGRRLQAAPVADLVQYCREQVAAARKVVDKLVLKYGAHVVPVARRTEFDALPVGAQQRSPSAADMAALNKALGSHDTWRDRLVALEALVGRVAGLPEIPDPPFAPGAGLPPGDGRNLDLS